ncbi:hypothetical protein ACEPPN_000383 [Leptodophora sp. 'Broadleaf-Isolate-01']
MVACTKHLGHPSQTIRRARSALQHRHIRGVYDEPPLSLTRVLDQKYCVLCKKDFKRPCDLVRHEKSFHDETYISRADKFATHPTGFARAPTPPDTCSNASTGLDDPASESEQEDIGVSETTHTYLCTAQNESKIIDPQQAQIFKEPTPPARGSLLASSLYDGQTYAYCSLTPAWELAEDALPRLALLLVRQQALLV